MSKIKFSIILPVYNRESVVGIAIESVINQTYDDWELLVIDDGSTDNTKMKVSGFTEVDCRIQYIYQTNRGVCAARNNGINHAKGDYILFLDSDQSFTENALEKLYQHIKKVSVDLLAFGYFETSTTVWKSSGAETERVIEKEIILEKYLPTHLNIYPQYKYFLKNYVWNKCYRRKYLEEHNVMFDENRRTWEDGYFLVHCLLNAKNMFIIDDIIYKAYSTNTVTHLSEKVFSGQLLQYVNDEEYYYELLGTKYIFFGTHYCQSNMNVLVNLLMKYRSMSR